MADPPAPAPADPAPRRDLFDRRRRRAVLTRAAALRAAGGDAVLLDLMAAELAERLGWVQRDFADALVVGTLPGPLAAALAARGIAPVTAAPAAAMLAAEEDHLPIGDARFDLVIALGTLDSVNDLPGALVLIRRALRPDGLFLGAMPGAGSLPRLKAAMLAGDEATGHGAAARVHPQIDVRAAGDLLQRAGFAMPVADGDTVTLRYPGLPGLVRDLRVQGWSRMLASPAPGPGRTGLIAAAQHFAAAADPDGRTAESFALIYLSGWAPAPHQPRPARRGSATASLADALKPRSA